MSWIMRTWRNLTGRDSAPYLVPVEAEPAATEMTMGRHSPAGVTESLRLSVHNSAVNEALTMMYRDMNGGDDHEQ